MIYFSFRDSSRFLLGSSIWGSPNPISGFRWCKTVLCPYKGSSASGSSYSYGSLYPFNFLMSKSWGNLPSTPPPCPQLASPELQPLTPRPSKVNGAAQTLSSHPSFLESTNAPGTFCLLLDLSPVLLHFLVSCLMLSHRHLFLFCPGFLVVLSEKIDLYYLVHHYWKWQILLLFLFCSTLILLFYFTLIFLPHYTYF